VQSAPGEHLWIDTNASGDLCYVPEPECCKPTTEEKRNNSQCSLRRYSTVKTHIRSRVSDILDLESQRQECTLNACTTHKSVVITQTAHNGKQTQVTDFDPKEFQSSNSLGGLRKADPSLDCCLHVTLTILHSKTTFDHTLDPVEKRSALCVALLVTSNAWTR
ncbi:LOW QUALITY PROTEIN: hypothetical protein T265_14269, partial [Opisthorchis viverrini]